MTAETEREPAVYLTGRLICESQAQADIVTAHLPLHVQLTRAEQGCVSFTVEPSEDPLVWNVSECFVDRNAFASHQKRVAGSAWGAATAEIARDYDIVELPAGSGQRE